MKKIIILLIPMLLGLYSSNFLVKYLFGFNRLQQQFFLTLYIVFFGYLFIESTVVVMRRLKQIEADDYIVDNIYGHLCNFLGAGLIAYGYVNRQLELIAAGVVAMLAAVSMLTKVDGKVEGMPMDDADADATPSEPTGTPTAKLRHRQTKGDRAEATEEELRARLLSDVLPEQRTPADARLTPQVSQAIKAMEGGEAEDMQVKMSQAAPFKPILISSAPPKPKEEMPLDAATQALLATIEKNKAADPLIGLRLGSKEITQTVFQGLKTDKGVRVECALGIVGALAGYACHVWAVEEYNALGESNRPMALVQLQDQAGRTYYDGNLPNGPLLEEKYSLWSLVGGAVKALTDKPLLDINALAEETVQSVGDQFGVPDLPLAHMPADLPINYVKDIWPVLLPKMDLFCGSAKQRAMLLGMCAQAIIDEAKETIPPMLAAEIVMKCALPMSKISADWLKAEYKRPY